MRCRSPGRRTGPCPRAADPADSDPARRAGSRGPKPRRAAAAPPTGPDPRSRSGSPGGSPAPSSPARDRPGRRSPAAPAG